MTITRAIQFAALVGAIFVTALLIATSQGSFMAQGSAIQGQEYNSTTTVAATNDPAIRLLKTGSGSLGSVIITGAATGVIKLYNATTTDINLRTGQPATSSILLAQFPASAAAGTYTFDSTFSAGLVLETSTVTPTTTVTWR